MRYPSPNDKQCVSAIAIISFMFVGWVFFTGFNQVVGAYDTDILRFFYPLRHFVHQEVLEGRLPLWNPHLIYGMPLHSEGQAGLAYPLHLLTSPLPTTVAVNLHAVIHVFLAGLFMFYYLNSLRISRFAALISASVYMLSSFAVGRLYAGHYSMWPFLAILPGMLWVWQRFLQSGNLRWIPSAALLYASGILAGFPQSVFYMSIYLGWIMVWTFCGRCICQRKRSKSTASMLRRAGFFIIALAIGIGIGAVQLVPTLDYASRSFRQTASLEFIGSYSFVPEAFISFLAPGFFGDLGDSIFWGRTYLWETWIYIGILPLALGLGAAMRPRGASQWAHALAIPVFLILALGRFTPLLSLLYHHVPGFNVFRGMSRFLLYAIFSLVTLAAVGMDRIFLSSPRPLSGNMRTRTLLILLIVAVILMTLLLITGHQPPRDGSNWTKIIEGMMRLNQKKSEIFEQKFSIHEWNAHILLWWQTARYWLMRGLILSIASIGCIVALSRFKRRSAVIALIMGVFILGDLYTFAIPYIRINGTDNIELDDRIVATIRAHPPSRTFATTVLHSHFMIDRLDTTQGYAGLISSRQNSYLASVAEYDPSESLAYAPVPQTLNKAFLRGNVNFLLMSRNASFAPDFARPVVDTENSRLLKLSHWRPRAWFADDVNIVHSLEQGGGILTEQAKIAYDAPEELADIVEIAQDSPPLVFQALSPDAFSSNRIKHLAGDPCEVQLETRTDAPRLLVLADTWDPDWVCLLDEETPLEIYPVDVNFRGVVVPAGEHTVSFYYQPQSFRLGLLISLLSLGLLGLGCALLYVFRRRKANDVAPA